ncbi:ECF transporter S component [Cytobacillus sp. FJAT-53684]|uniref:ECF transporter S component n=1 Tax=Cytobacillus mangrovibacter TaxID=3299024 RepID=A0ABW6K3Y7_9BACI
MKSKKMAFISLLVALTAIGAAIKIPSNIGSVALDAFPALLAAALLGSQAGAIVGGMGHLLSALLGGMPLGPLHFVVAIEMAFLAVVFALLYRNGKKWQAGLLFVLGNTFAAPLPFLFLMGKAFYLSIVPSLFVGSVINTIIALVIIPRLSSVVELMISKKKASR